MTTVTPAREWVAALDCTDIRRAPVVPYPSTLVWPRSCMATWKRFTCTRLPGHTGRHHAKALHTTRSLVPGQVLAVWS